MVRMGSRPGWRVALGLLLLCSLFAVSAIIYSPWHQHHPYSPQVCGFSQFEHGGNAGPSSEVHIATPAGWTPFHLEEQTAHLPRPLLAQPVGRAPPA